MSLDKLSTELDTTIAKHLDKAALSTFSKTSKYYRSVAEPYLYKDVLLRGYDECTLKRLFFTLLDRKELAQHIRNMTIVDHGASTLE